MDSGRDKNDKRYTFLKDTTVNEIRMPLILAICAAAVLGIVLFISYVYAGEAGAAIGAAGLAGMLTAFYSFAQSLRMLRKHQNEPRFYAAVLSTILSGVVSIGYLALFLLGLGK
ncbi:MAG: hypothetical protein UHN88_01095 [Eubacterium sp.]|nr:hypothetical protein [Eubacterium sp.]